MSSRGKRAPGMLTDDPVRTSLLDKLAAFRRDYLAEFKDDGGDDLSLIDFVIAGLAQIRYEERKR